MKSEEKRLTACTYHQVRREKLIIVHPILAILLTLALFGAVSRVRCKRLLESFEALQKVTGIKRLPARPRRVHHREQILGPEVAIGGVDIGYVAKELQPVDLDQTIRSLQTAETCHEELQY